MDRQGSQVVVAFPETHIGLVDAFLRGLPSDATRQVYRRALRAFETHLGRELLAATRRDVEGYRAHLEALGRSPSTVCQHLSAISGLYEFALGEGDIDRNPVATTRRPKLPDCSPRRALTQAEVRALLATPDPKTLVGLRDRALLTVLAVQGLRVSEALGLRLEDLAQEQGHDTAQVYGKGSKVVRVPLAHAAWGAVTAWTTAAGITTGPIFVPVLKGGRVVPGGQMSAQAAWKRIGAVARSAGLSRHVHAHLFRHTAVTVALDAGVPLRDVQDFARHADPRTTRRYDSHRMSLNNRAPHVLGALLCPGQAESVGGRG